MLTYITISLAFGYLLLALQCRRGFLRIHKSLPSIEGISTPPVTIIIAARNEANVIGECLDALVELDYPDELLDIIVINDGSEDETAAIVSNHPIQARSLQLIETETSGGKRSAIQRGLQACKTEIVLTTDADCHVPSTWIRSMLSRLTPETAFVAGPVVYSYGSSLAEQIQALEFLGLVAVGAGSIGAGLPTICNSANLCYRRSVYEEALESNPELSALPGFDEALLQLIPDQTDWRVAFSPGRESAVQTRPTDTIAEFFRQRVRWASMAGVLPDRRVRAISVFLFSFFASLLLSVAFLFSNSALVAVTLCSIGLKVAADCSILLPAMRAYGRQDLLRALIPAEFLHVPYILATSLIGSLQSFLRRGEDVSKW